MNFSSISLYLQNNVSNIIYITLAILIFTFIGIMIWRSSSKVNSSYRNISNNSNTSTSSTPTDIYLFYATWCPHCKTALPKWKSFCDSVDGTVVNGSLISTHTIDCTNAEDPNVIHYLNEFKVNSFPTIKGIHDNTVVNFDASINENTLNQFLQQITV